MEAQNKQGVIDSYIAKARPMPTLPEAVVRILEMSENPDVEVEEVADAILMDKVLTARMIRLVNSAFWGIRRHITSVREAIVYLGLHQIRSIVVTTSLFNTFHSRNPSFRVAAIWEHGLGCAMISRIIAQKIGFQDLEKAYLAGLMHDIGEVVLSQFDVEKFDEIIALVQTENMSFFEAENRILGVTHSDFSGWFKEQWGFSDEMAEVISAHHAIEKASINPRLVAVVVLANLFCQVRGLDYGYSREVGISFKDEPAWKKLAEMNPDLNSVDLARFTLDLDGMVDEVKEIVKAVYRNQPEDVVDA
jgi:HD-like signal output (HDOD) protein